VNPRSYFSTPRDSPDSWLRRSADALVNLFFPDACLVCGIPIARAGDRAVCDTCWKRVLQLRIAPPWCPSCGIPYQQWNLDSSHLCGECLLELPSYAGARSFGYYSSELRRLVHALKFFGRKNLADLLAPQLASAFLNTWDRDEVELIVPIPLHPKRARDRGFNQAAVLGRPLARLLGIAYHEGVLSRVRETLPQVGLSDRARVQNLRGAFRCVERSAVEGRRVLLVDDVMTTGATIASATRTLLEGGASRVCVLTLARAVRGLAE